MSTKPYRIKLETTGGQIAIDFRAHEKDPTLVVVKTVNPEIFDDLIALVGVDPEVQNSFKGAHYHIIVLTKAGAAKLLSALVVGLATKADAAAAVEAGDDEGHGGHEGDDGGDEGGDEGEGDDDKAPTELTPEGGTDPSIH